MAEKHSDAVVSKRLDVFYYTINKCHDSESEFGQSLTKRGLDFSSPPMYNLLRKVVGNEVPISLSQLKFYSKYSIRTFFESRDAIPFCYCGCLCKAEPQIPKAKV